MPLATLIRELWLDLCALVWPTRCVSCGLPDRDCCMPCRVELRSHAAAVRLLVDGVPVAACGGYDGPLRAVLVAFKHGGRTGFAGELSALLGSALEAAIAAADQAGLSCDPPVIVAAPSRPARVRERGFRHLDVLIGRAMRERGIAGLRVAALRAARGRRSQQGLGAAERVSNAALVETRRTRRNVLAGRRVILVDDVVTTGATVSAAKSVLEAAGAQVVGIAALCVVQRQSYRLTGTRGWKPLPPVE